MPDSEPLVSVIMPVYNTKAFLADSIESILKQSYKNFELLIYDDLSTDGSNIIIREYAEKDSRIRDFKGQYNIGAGKARNFLIQAAIGRFVAFCDSDDKWEPEKLAVQVRYLLENSLDLTYSSYKVVNSEGKLKRVVNAKEKVSYDIMLRNNYIGCLTAIYDTNRLGKRYMPDMRKRQDWACWLDILKETQQVQGIRKVLATYTERNDSISKKKLNMIKYNWLVYYKHEKFGIFKSIICLIYFMFFYFGKKVQK